MSRPPTRTIRVYTHGFTPDTGIGTALSTLVAESPQHIFQVFVTRSQAGRSSPQNVEVIPVRCVERPLVAQYLTFPLGVLANPRWWNRSQIWTTLACDAVFPARMYWLHFCHTAYLRNQKHKSLRSLRGRGLARKVDHLVRSLFERGVRTSSLLVFPTSRLRSEFRSELNFPASSHSVVLPNLPDESRVWSRFEKKVVVPHNLEGIIVAGGAFERKGVYDVLPALVGLPNVRLTVLGGGNDEVEQGRTAAEKLGVGDRVRFLGWIANPADATRDAHFAIFVSHYEVASVALAEAVGSGMPILVSQAANADNLVVDLENGVVIEKVTADDISEGLRRLLTNYASFNTEYGSKALAELASDHTTALTDLWSSLERSS